jgi:hypothetical protein
MRIVHLIAVGSMLAACGSANVNKLFGSQDDSYASLLQRAQYAYDEGDFSEAEKLANKAYGRAENNGEAGILLGNIYLSQAGIDIFQLVGKLSTLSSSSSSTDSSASKCKSTPTSGQNQSASNVLGELSCLLLSLSDADKDALGTTVETTATTYPGLKAIGVPSVYIPNKVNDTLRSNVAVLGALDKGIKALCPFINRTNVLAKSIDKRHSDSNLCPNRTSTSFNNAKAHISFALLHLVEALVFQQGVLIDGVGSAETQRTGVQGISSKISSYQTNNPTNIGDLALATANFAQVVGQVFNTVDPESQIALALNGLIMVSTSFNMAGVPSSITNVITKQLENIQQIAGGSNSSTAQQSQALAGQINLVYANQMATTIDAACPGGACTTEQKTQLCQGFNSISAGTDPAKLRRPAACPATVQL